MQPTTSYTTRDEHGGIIACGDGEPPSAAAPSAAAPAAHDHEENGEDLAEELGDENGEAHP